MVWSANIRRIFLLCTIILLSTVFLLTLQLHTGPAELEQFQTYSVMMKLPAIRSTSKNGVPIPIFQRLGYFVQIDMNYYGNN